MIIDKISPELLSVLLQLGNRRGDSLLHLAVTYNQDAIAKLIIDKISPELLSVLLQLQNREGANLLSVLAKHNQWEIMIETQLELIESIMDKIPADLLPAILQIQDNYGNTVLHVAISSGNEKIIESIMDKIPADLLPALLQIQGKYVNTVLHVAIRSGNEKIIKSIIDKIPADLLPALLQIQDKDGNTLLNLLVEDKWEINQDKWEMIESIMDKFPADLLPTFLQIRTRDGHNLLSLMVRQNKWEMIKSIMDKIPADLLPDFLSELSIIAIGIKSPTSLNMLEEALNYTIHSETKFFNINSISVDGERIIDIAQKLYTHTQKPSVLKLINDLRIAGSVEPKEKIVWKEAIEENINLKELDSSIENKKITRKVLTRLDGYNLLEEQIDNNINWLKAKGIDNCVNTEWTHGIIFTVPQIIDKLSEDNMRQVDDRLGVNWDFKKVLATIIYIARISDDQSMSDNLIGTLSELNMCDLGKLMHLVYVVQTKFINDMEAAQKSIEYSENEISFLFQNTFDGLKNELGGDENKIAQAIKTWVLELTDDAVARKAPEQWSFTTLKVHGLFNSGLIVLINNKNLNYDSSHFIFLRNNVIEPMIDSITTSQAIELSGIINEWHKLYIHSKNLYFQQEFDKIVEAPDSMEGVFENFTLSPHSYYGVLKGIDLNVFAKFYKKLLDKGDEYAKNFIKIAQEYEFLNPEQIHAVQVSSEEPSLFDGDIAIAMQASRSFAREDKKKDEEKKDGGKERDDAITTYLFTAADEHNDDSIHPAGATVIGDLD
ncbi:Ankyrin repeat-containing protein [Candidatus Megaera venefica]|uniref:Ankyrin repeat-containing protein n=1 Tax=Candidatus Megaera venefica TaxID=2055910 RepID=A0ABU5NEE8_9RICK|nr:Ankyrin repeat-containing protein [Candidatus Megaera venefica]